MELLEEEGNGQLGPVGSLASSTDKAGGDLTLLPGRARGLWNHYYMQRAYTVQSKVLYK